MTTYYVFQVFSFNQYHMCRCAEYCHWSDAVISMRSKAECQRSSQQWWYSEQQHNLSCDFAFIQQFYELHSFDSNKQQQIMICKFI